MKNLTNRLSKQLQDKLKDFKIGIIFIENNELNVRSEFDINGSFIQAIENELKELGFKID